MTNFYPVPACTLLRPETPATPAPRRGALPVGFFPTNSVPIVNTPRQGAMMNSSSSPAVLLAASLFGVVR